MHKESTNIQFKMLYFWGIVFIVAFHCKSGGVYLWDMKYLIRVHSTWRCLSLRQDIFIRKSMKAICGNFLRRNFLD